MPNYSFCESVNALPLGPWHIRPLTEEGQKLGGGVDTDSLCGRVKAPMGWDVDVPFSEKNLAACPKCLARLNNRP